MFEEFAYHEFAGTENLRMPYRVLSPKDLAPNQTYPLVLFFHGSGERGNDNEKQLLHGVQRFATAASRSSYPCFLVAPQCPTDLHGQQTMWTGERERMHELKLAPEPAVPLRTALELFAAILKKLPIDRDKVYLTGISMGGFATWEALIRQPHDFAAAIPVCGGGDANHAERIKHIPIWAFHGANDSTVSVQCSRSMIEMLKKAGGNPRYTEYPGVGHNSWDRAYAEPELLSWLFSQKRG
jgi:predicted peptidase